MAEAPTRAIEGVYVVLAGTFNPVILQPSWLAAKALIRQEESDAAVVEVIHRDLTSFHTGWLDLQVEQDRFQAHTSDPAHYLPLRDLVVGIFSLLEHTPVKALGIIRNMHFRMPSEERWHAFGDMLAPKAPWDGILEPIVRRSGGAELPGLRAVVMEGKRPGSAGKWFRVKVEPSYRIPNGVYIETHEHFEPRESEPLQTLLGTLERDWTEALAYAEGAAERLLLKVLDP